MMKTVQLKEFDLIVDCLERDESMYQLDERTCSVVQQRVLHLIDRSDLMMCLLVVWMTVRE